MTAQPINQTKTGSTTLDAEHQKNKNSAAISYKYTGKISKIEKRNGGIVPFDLNRITNAIFKAMQTTDEGSYEEASLVATKILAELVPISKRYKNFIPTVEGIQDAT